MDRFDFVVIGAGPGGYVAAIRGAQLGLKTALVEKEPTLGGTCLNVGCIPSKVLLESSEAYHAAQHHLADHGVICREVGLDLSRMMARKAAVVKELTSGIGLLMKKNKVKVVTGTGRLAGTGRVTVATSDGDVDLEAGAICLATGSVPVALPGVPFDGARVVTSTEALSFGEVPQHLVVVGAGAVGLELGSVWRRLGAQVTVVEMLPRIAPFADKQLSGILERALKAQGLVFHLESKVTGVATSDDGAVVTVTDVKGATEELTCDRVLVAVGRRPLTTGVGLEEAGVALDRAGRVKTDQGLATNVPGVYAIGDLVAGPMLAHKAEEEGVAVAEIVAGKPGHVSYDTIPNVVYTAPELACVGMTQDEAKEQDVPHKVGRFYYRANGRAKSLMEEEGLVKVVAHQEHDRLLGVHIVGSRASELIAEAVVAMELGASAEDLARTCHAHPTLSEIVKEAALAVDRRAIHG